MRKNVTEKTLKDIRHFKLIFELNDIFNALFSIDIPVIISKSAL